MATTRTTALALGIPGAADRNYDLVIDPNWSIIDGMAALGPLAVRAYEAPSLDTRITVAAGTFRASNGVDVAYAGDIGVYATSSAVTKVWLTDAGVLATGSSYPSGPIVRLASVTCTFKVTAVVDDRRVFASTGTPPRLPVRTVTGATDTPTLADGLILADSTSNAIAFTLTALTTADSGKPLTIIRTNSGGNNVTVATASGGTVTLSAQYQVSRVVWSGTAWFTV